MHAEAVINPKALQIVVRGRVQAVGYRPFVWRLATQMQLRGFVLNRPGSVMIHIEGSTQQCHDFQKLLRKSAPVAAVIKQISVQDAEYLGLTSFDIRPSEELDEVITDVCPDIAICDDCKSELFAQNRRHAYPLINCTNCGPRFTLIEEFPYDRKNTTMRSFPMCVQCQEEFSDPRDRRFHAQPTSCPDCGPEYIYYAGNNEFRSFPDILDRVCNALNRGQVIAIKGLGGYNLACNALDRNAVEKIREHKLRERKPFALMFRDMASLEEHVFITGEEKACLSSWRRPVLVLRQKETSGLPEQINPNLRSLGVFLPYLPLHHLLFEKLTTPAIVLTSGNMTDTPIIHREEAALEAFREIPGGILTNNRPIARRCDDSVVRMIAGHAQIMRRARGFTPEPVDLSFNADGILAAGAELANCFCIGKSQRAILSQHIGDLRNADTYDFFVENIAEFWRIYRFKPGIVACDLHPDYLSTKYARSLGVPVIGVQHHHAHIAAVMAEHGLNEKVIGLAWDGTGLGTDGNIWGSEALVADFRSFDRLSHFRYIPLPGGDQAIRQPWRTALSCLWQTFGDSSLTLDLPPLIAAGKDKAARIVAAIQKGINSPLSSGAGRLFDAIAALTGLCTESNYHAEAPMLLEDMANPDLQGVYPFHFSPEIDLRPMIRSIVEDMGRKIPLPEIAGKFHSTLARIGLEQARHAKKESGISKIALGGGTFQNKLLTEKLVHLLEQDRFQVFLPVGVPANDGGIALGQMAVAANQKR